MKSIKKSLYFLIQGAELLGLPDSDIISAREYLENNEYGLCFDLIVTQLYEYDIEIDANYYTIIVETGNKMNLLEESYSYIKKMIRMPYTIPQAVKNKISEIINNLNQSY